MALYAYKNKLFKKILEPNPNTGGGGGGGGGSGGDGDDDGTPTPEPDPGTPPTPTPTPTPPPTTPGAYVPILAKDLKVQQPDKYKLIPGTEGKGPAGPQIYQIGGKKRVITGNYESGSQGASDGIRSNIINQPDLINREVTWIFILKQILDSKNKDHYGSKCGSHSDSGSALYTNSVEYAGGPLKFQQEAPHGRYVKCGTCGKQITAASPVGTITPTRPINLNKKIAWKFIQWTLPGNKGMHIEVWHDYTSGGAKYVKIGEMDDLEPGCCMGPPVGHGGMIQAPAPGNGNVEDTMRVNGGVVQWLEQSIMEIAVPSAPKGPTGGTNVPDSSAGSEYARAFAASLMADRQLLKRIALSS